MAAQEQEINTPQDIGRVFTLWYYNYMNENRDDMYRFYTNSSVVEIGDMSGNPPLCISNVSDITEFNRVRTFMPPNSRMYMTTLDAFAVGNDIMVLTNGVMKVDESEPGVQFNELFQLRQLMQTPKSYSIMHQTRRVLVTFAPIQPPVQPVEAVQEPTPEPVKEAPVKETRKPAADPKSAAKPQRTERNNTAREPRRDREKRDGRERRDREPRPARGGDLPMIFNTTSPAELAEQVYFRLVEGPVEGIDEVLQTFNPKIVGAFPHKPTNGYLLMRSAGDARDIIGRHTIGKHVILCEERRARAPRGGRRNEGR